jgi:hypothetical protein
MGVIDFHQQTNEIALIACHNNDPASLQLRWPPGVGGK